MQITHRFVMGKAQKACAHLHIAFDMQLAQIPKPHLSTRIYKDFGLTRMLKLGRLVTGVTFF